MQANAQIRMNGKLNAKISRGAITAPISWKIRNTIRPGFWLGWLEVRLARMVAQLTGIPVLTSRLRVLVIKASGPAVDYGTVCYRKVTTAGVNWLVDCWQGTYEPETMKYHGCGTGTVAESNSDTALETESTTALNPDSTRATGSLTEGSSNNVFQSVGTLTFDSGAAVTEHGLFNQSGTGGGTLWDRSVFSAINVTSGDSIQFTYDLTVSAEA